MSGSDFGMATYAAKETKVMLLIESWKERGKFVEGRSFSYGGKAYELWSEARAAEHEGSD